MPASRRRFRKETDAHYLLRLFRETAGSDDWHALYADDLSWEPGGGGPMPAAEWSAAMRTLVDRHCLTDLTVHTSGDGPVFVWTRETRLTSHGEHLLGPAELIADTAGALTVPDRCRVQDSRGDHWTKTERDGWADGGATEVPTAGLVRHAPLMVIRWRV